MLSYLRNIWFVFLLFISVYGFAQMKSEKITFKGKEYNLYPVRFEYNDNHTSYRYYQNYILRSNRKIKKERRSNSWDINISDNGKLVYEESFAYNPFPLPDGEYVAYYKKLYFKDVKEGKHRVPIYRHKDTVRVAATFRIVNNNLEGKIQWYDFYDPSLIVQQGQFVNGVKEGEWRMKINKKELTYNYVGNNLTGKFAITYNGKVRREGELLNGEFVSQKTYFKNGKVNRNSQYVAGDLIFKERWYKKSGKIRSVYNNTDTASYRLVRYDKKGAILFISRKLPDGNMQMTTYYPSGKLLKEIVCSDDSVVSFNSRQHNLANWYADLDRSLYYKFVLSEKSYFENGEIRYEFDAKNESNEVLKQVNKKGKVLRHFYFSKDVLVAEEYFNDYLTRESLYENNYGFQTIKTESFKKGELRNVDVYLDNTSYFEDSVGFIVTEYDTHKKYSISVVELHHTDLRMNIYNDKHGNGIKEDYAYKMMIKGGDTAVFLSKTEYSKKNDLKIVHASTYPYGLSNNPSYANWQYSSILNPNDTTLFVIYYKDKPYSGNINVKPSGRYATTKNNVKVKDKSTKYSNNIVLKNYEYGYRWSDMNFSSAGGVLDGSYEDGYFESISYANGLRNGIKTGSIDGYYIQGVKHGFFSTSKEKANYFQNKLTGEYLRIGLLKNQIELRAHFKDDQLHGSFERYYFPFKTYEKGSFDNGLIDGAYSSGTEAYPVLAEMNFDKGYLVDTSRYYFNEGILKVLVSYKQEDYVLPQSFPTSNRLKRVLDSLLLTDLNSYEIQKSKLAQIQVIPSYYSHRNNYTFYDVAHSYQPFFSFRSNLTGQYTYFYKNGMKSMEGEIENYQRVGTWNFYDLNGGIQKIIDYTSDTFYNKLNGDTVAHFGTITMFYPNGKKLLNGLVMSESERFKCEQGLNVSLQDIYYLSFYDNSGNQTIKDGSGNVFEYHNNGTLRLEGYYSDGNREGVWKFYDPDGRLEEIGAYEKGEKIGMWYKGDLQGIPYFDNACALGVVDDTVDGNLIDATSIKKPLHITSTNYDIVSTYLQRNVMVFYPLY